MKVKYLRLSKKERKEVKNEFYQTENGKYIKKKLTGALICSILLFVMGIYLIAEAFIKNLDLFQKIYSISIIVFAIGLLITYRKISVKKINEYVTRNKK